MRITKHNAVQVHPVPAHLTAPRGPFPRELFREPEIISDYAPQNPEDGGDFPLGATVQNNYKPPVYLRCALCLVRVLETETDSHMCDD
ncbi:hypothetical protein UFOVP965_136 [uncultured Caudovirales phage]|uniref:Uncharacterized protein n=1 Tax=uncultured Caudovirales phage TaxID=2100421 RepID=A0A6J5Q1I0_9CAUD|nr:hypothetical protein UFOVP965_136 [uncultured Caudovirales phage]CAB4179925.1 hypothetical protein UFOVP1035_132 [uncultured Caudovirales phage]CAB4188772.1 hypothetical protein UFOVP1181_91 [uncultured Caudovirales phage]